MEEPNRRYSNSLVLDSFSVVVILLKGMQPLVGHRILDSHQIQLAANVTQLELQSLEPDQEYGIQICGIYSTLATKTNFKIVPVIPFRCRRCDSSNSASECLECVKSDESSSTDNITDISTSSSSSFLSSPQIRGVVSASNASMMMARPLVPLECYGRECAARRSNHTTTHFISSNSAILDVLLGERTKGSEKDPKREQVFVDRDEAASSDSANIEDITSNGGSMSSMIANQTKIVTVFFVV